MGTTVNVPAEQRTVLWYASWETYERLLAERGEASVPRLTYDRGVLELMSPGTRHERLGYLIGLLVEVIAEEWGIEVTGLGHLTFREAAWDRGFEPDGCFYVGAAAGPAHHAERIDPLVGPAPDVVIEVDISRSSIDKLGLFQQFGIGEVWRHDGERVSFLVLGSDGYRVAKRSAAFPLLTAERMTALLDERDTTTQLDWLRRLRAWARDSRPQTS